MHTNESPHYHEFRQSAPCTIHVKEGSGRQIDGAAGWRWHDPVGAKDRSPRCWARKEITVTTKSEGFQWSG